MVAELASLGIAPDSRDPDGRDRQSVAGEPWIPVAILLVGEALLPPGSIGRQAATRGVWYEPKLSPSVDHALWVGEAFSM